MLEEYMLCLYKQYCSAKGLEFSNVKVYSVSFLDWIAENNYLLEEYMKYLNSIGYYYSQDNCIEIGKGIFDSLKEHNIKLISPFADTIGENNSRLIIDRGNPIVISDLGVMLPEKNTILAHNPYREEEIHNWNLVHNSRIRDISIGMFGRLDDNDAKRKIKILVDLSKRMTEDYSFNYDTDHGNYFCSLNSKRYVKILTKTRNI